MSVDPQPDRQFALALAAGEAAAVAHFEARCRPIVRHALGCALRRWRPQAPVESEDFVQDFVGFLFVDGGRKLTSFEARAPFGAWLYTVALRYFQRRLAQIAADRRSDVVLTALPSESRGPEHAAMAEQEAARLRTAVAALPPADRLFVRLFFVDGLNANEVARTLGKGPSAVRMRKLRILERLRGALGEAEGAGEGSVDADGDADPRPDARGRDRWQ